MSLIFQEDRPRIRRRMADDMRELARNLKSELDHYEYCFAPIERRKLREMIRTAEKMAKSCDLAENGFKIP